MADANGIPERARDNDYPIGVSFSAADGSVGGLFLQLGHIIPASQLLVTVGPLDSVGKAVAEMRKYNISQIPVVQNGKVLGLFSYRSFTGALLDMEVRQRPKDIAVHPVRDFMLNKPVFKAQQDDLGDVIKDLEREDAILIGDSEHLVGIITTVDALKIYYGAASPYVMIAETELAIRQLIRKSADKTALKACIEKAIKPTKERPDIPTALEEMTFNDYLQVVTHSSNWTLLFERAFGGTRELTRSKLEELRDLRNVLFHFRAELTQEQYEALKAHREWVQLQARTFDAIGTIA